MYVCLCNNITSKEIDRALESGILESKKIYSYYKCKPKCGKCKEYMDELIEERKQAQIRSKFNKEELVVSF